MASPGLGSSAIAKSSPLSSSHADHAEAATRVGDPLRGSHVSVERASDPSLTSIIRAMPGCFLIVACFWSGQWTLLDLSGGFYRSIQYCDLPVPGPTGRCPTGSVNQEN